MRILVLGTNGFIGSAVVGALIHAGFMVCAAVREPAALRRRFPGIQTLQAELRDAATHDSVFWSQAVEKADAVINIAGVLQARRERDAWAVHLHTPDALYTACERAGGRRIVHISATGVDEAETVYARSKRAGDKALKQMAMVQALLVLR